MQKEKLKIVVYHDGDNWYWRAYNAGVRCCCTSKPFANKQNARRSVTNFLRYIKNTEIKTILVAGFRLLKYKDFNRLLNA